LPGDWLWQDEAGLVFGKQPVDTALFPGKTFMFAKSLAPTPEIGRITLGFTLEHFIQFITVDGPVKFAMLHGQNGTLNKDIRSVK
jgi:hypothetical protein